MMLRRLLAAGFLLALLSAFMAVPAIGCGYGQVACQVVDTAHDACTVLRYMGPDGKPAEVKVPSSELAAFAHETSMRQGAARDAGTDQ